MKTYNELTTDQQAEARNHFVVSILGAIMEGAVRFNDELNGDTLQARIEAAGEKANAMQTPWFWSEYIMETCREDIEGMAQCDAEDAAYSGPNEHVVNGIV